MPSNTTQPKKPPYKPRRAQLNLKLPVDLIDRVEERQARLHGWLVTDVVIKALLDWCDAKEAEWRHEHGHEMPERPSGHAGRMPRGRPWRHENTGPRLPLSVKIPGDLKNRFYKVAFHQKSPGDYPARALADALELWLAAYKPRNTE